MQLKVTNKIYNNTIFIAIDPKRGIDIELVKRPTIIRVSKTHEKKLKINVFLFFPGPVFHCATRHFTVLHHQTWCTNQYNDIYYNVKRILDFYIPFLSSSSPFCRKMISDF